MSRRTLVQMLEEAREQVELVAPDDLAAQDLEQAAVLLVDVREGMERRGQGTIRGALHVPRGVLEWWACPSSPFFRPGGPFGDFGRPVITFCTGGGNGALTAMTLQELGYRDVATVEGGFMAWVEAGLPTVPIES